MKGRRCMNILLIFFALPIAVIILSIALQKLLKCPALVAAIIFAIFLIVTFVINNLQLLIAAIVYAILSFITAYITCLVVAVAFVIDELAVLKQSELQITYATELMRL